MSPVYTLPSYPKEIRLADGSSATLRPMAPQDEAAVLDFFRRVPARDRFYLKDDVTSPSVIHGWAMTLDYNRVIPLLVIKADKVIANGSLHFRYGARRHVGEVRIVVDPDYRNRGVGKAIMRELIRLAREKDLVRLLMEVLPPREEAAVRATSMLGFVPLAMLPGCAIDQSGLLEQDLIVMVLELEEAHG